MLQAINNFKGPVETPGLLVLGMRTPDGHSRIGLTKLHSPTPLNCNTNNPPVNTLGIRRIMFSVENVEDVVTRLSAYGAELVGEIVQYENVCRLCYIRGPEGIIIGLAEPLN